MILSGLDLAVLDCAMNENMNGDPVAKVVAERRAAQPFFAALALLALAAGCNDRPVPVPAETKAGTGGNPMASGFSPSPRPVGHDSADSGIASAGGRTASDTPGDGAAGDASTIGVASPGDAGAVPPPSSGADGGACTNLAFGGRPVFVVSHTGDRPASAEPQGGTLIDGTYDIVSWDDYRTIEDSTSDVPTFWTLRLSGAGTSKTVMEEINGIASRQWTVASSGTTLSLSLQCGDAGGDPLVEGFTASATQISLTTPLWVLVFERRP